jgi:hypothetical protein
MLKRERLNLLQLLSDPATSLDAAQALFTTYTSLLRGFIHAPSGGESKLRYSIKPKWSQSLASTCAHEEQDATFELISMLTNMALWLTKHAAYVAAVAAEPTETQAKEVHKCLRTAAGMFKFVQENLVDKLIRSEKTRPEAWFDTEDLVLATYISQCKAEAQEITIARAIELKHSPSLVCSIGWSTSLLFQAASDGLRAMEKKAVVEKWGQYLALKARFYKAHAFCYYGEDLLARDLCGEAIKCLEEARRVYAETEELCRVYGATRGAGTQAIPERHRFFKNLGVMIGRVSEKCQRENGMIYHQKVAVETPVLDVKAVHGLAEPEEFVLPDLHVLWTRESYESFNLSRAVEAKIKPENNKAKIPPPDEAPM